MLVGPLETRLYHNDFTRTLLVIGELDVATAPILEDAVDRAFDGPGVFRLDLSGLTFMDSAGARAIMHAHNTVESLGRRLVVLSPTPVVYRVLALTGLDQVIDIKSEEPARVTPYA
jgi:anti-anti-sigma factor